MKSYIFFLVALLFTVCTYSQVTNTINNLKVNSISSSQINFGNNTNISVTFQVKLGTTNGSSNNILGNLFIYTKKTTSSPAIQRSSSAVTFVASYYPTVPETTYNNETFFTVSLSNVDFETSGGVLYAEYKNNSNQIYKSLEIPVTKNSSSSGISSLTITDIKYQETSQTIVDTLYIPDSTDETLISFNFSRTIPQGQSCEGRYRVVGDDLNGENLFRTIVGYSPSGCISNGNPYNSSFTNVVLKKADYENGGDVRLQLANDVTQYYLNGNKIPVKILKFSARNTIFTNDLVVNSSANFFINGFSVAVEMGKTWDPRSNKFVPRNVTIDEFKWYKRVNGSAWDLIPNQEEGALMVSNLTQTTDFVRRAFYKGCSVESNILTITVIQPNGINSICCDRIISSENVGDPIIGNDVGSQFIIQWQRQSRSSDWTSISDANSRDYIPTNTTSTSSYRRVIILRQNTGVRYISNIVKISYNLRPIVGRFSSDKNDDIEETLYDKIIVYPNPSSSIITIYDTQLTGTITIYDITGREIKGLKITKVNEETYNVDVSQLSNSTYILKVGNKMKQFIKN